MIKSYYTGCYIEGIQWWQLSNVGMGATGNPGYDTNNVIPDNDDSSRPTIFYFIVLSVGTVEKSWIPGYEKATEIVLNFLYINFRVHGRLPSQFKDGGGP